MKERTGGSGWSQRGKNLKLVNRTVSSGGSVCALQFLYPVLPALLDCNPFSGGPGGLQVPAAVQQVLLVLTRTWKLLSDCRVHPEISSQLMGYMFYFISASLFNSFMERGVFTWSSSRTFYLHLNVFRIFYFMEESSKTFLTL